jgi:Trp operon repressor
MGLKKIRLSKSTKVMISQGLFSFLKLNQRNLSNDVGQHATILTFGSEMLKQVIRMKLKI